MVGGKVRAYVSVDMEGVSGLTDPDDMRPGGGGYPLGQVFMTEEANAAIRGAYAAGADEVLVNDAHHRARNLRLDLIDRRCRVIRGRNRPLRQAEGLAPGLAGAMLIGYHSRAGADACGVLSHTLMGREIENVHVNGRVVGEIGLVAGLAGSFGVPVVLVTGDEAACEEARELLGNVETVAVKRGIDRFSADLLPPEDARERIEHAAQQALRTAEDRAPLHIEEPVHLAVEWNSTTIASTCALLPQVHQAGPRHIEYSSPTFAEAVHALGVLMLVASQLGADSGPYG